MKIREMIEKRSALEAESKELLANDGLTVEQEARGHEIANEMQQLTEQIRAAQLRERFASNAAVQKVVTEKRERQEEWRATTEYRDQWLSYMRGGSAPEQRELITTSSSSVLIPKLYEDSILKYLSANTVVRNLADLRTGVQGYTTLRYNTLETNQYTSAWTEPDTGTVATTDTDPGFAEVPLAPVPCLPKVEISQQLIRQSNFDIEAEVVEHIQRQMAKNLEWGYIGGTGTNSPTGIFKVNANTHITATTSAGTTRAAAITAGITLAKLTEMRYEKLPAAYWASAVWILPQDAYAELAGLTANNVPLFVPSADAGVATGSQFTLLGLPVYVTEYLPAHVSTGSTGKNVVAVLGNISEGFAVREWGGISMIRDEYSLSQTARVRFQGMMFANSNFTRVKALVQNQVTNA